jgi:hypothetical protein
MRTKLPRATAKRAKGEEPIYAEQNLDSLDPLLSSIASLSNPSARALSSEAMSILTAQTSSGDAEVVIGRERREISHDRIP